MKLDDFRLLDREARRGKPKIFMLAAPDPPATEEALAELEKAIGLALPPSYRGFLGEFGGGDYGLVTVFSADPESEWYLAAQLDEARAYLPAGLLPFSDDGAGGMYVLRVSDGRAEEPVMYWHEDGGLVPTRFGDVLDFVARYAFE
jgi:SMI1-KNR4 cell-wall